MVMDLLLYMWWDTQKNPIFERKPALASNCTREKRGNTTWHITLERLPTHEDAAGIHLESLGIQVLTFTQYTDKIL